MQFLIVLASALLSLVVLAAVVGFVLKRRPLLFVADKLPANLYDGADDVGDLINGPDGEETIARGGVEVSSGRGPVNAEDALADANDGSREETPGRDGA